MRKDVHYYGLDILRLGAAGLVLANHFGLYGWAVPTAHAHGKDLAFAGLAGMVDIGSVGVEIFFLVSGFVIAASARGATAGQFLLNRAIRVFPALWMCGLVALAARWFAGEPPHVLIADFIRSAVLWPAGEYIDGVVWSLVVEAAFYVLIALVLLGGRFDRIDAVAKTLGVVSALFVSLMAAVLAIAAVDPRLGHLAALLDRFPTKFFLLRHGVFFALGILLWSGFQHGFSRRGLGWMAAMAAFCTLEIAINRGLVPTLVAIVLWWGGLAWVVVSVAASEAIHDRLHGRDGLWKDMGRLSYPLYLNHYALAMVMVPALFSHRLATAAVFSITLAVVVATSYFIMRVPERLAQRALRAKLLPRREREAHAASANLASSGGGMQLAR